MAMALTVVAGMSALSQLPTGRAPRKDLQGDSLPAGCCGRLGTIRLRHGEEVTCVAFAPDGKTFISGGKDKVIRLWETAGGRLRRQFYGHSDAVTYVAFAPDGESFASASRDGTVRVWAIENGAEQHRLGEKDAMMPAMTLAIAFAPDGKSVATAGSDKSIHLWQLMDDKEIKSFDGHDGEIKSIAFTPDGKKLLSASDDKSVRLWNVEDGKQLRAWEKLAGAVKSLALSADGKQVAVALDAPAEKDEKLARIRLWDVDTGNDAVALASRDAAVHSVCFAPDGKTLATIGEGLCIWDIATKAARLQWEHGGVHFTCVAFAADGKTLALGSSGHSVWLLDTSGKQLTALDCHIGSVVSLAYSADGKTVAAVSDTHEVRVWDAAVGKTVQQTWKCLGNDEAKKKREVAFRLSPDGKFLAAHQGVVVRLWDTATGEQTIAWQYDKETPPDSSPSPQMAYSADSRLLAFTTEGRHIQIMDTAEKKKVKSIEAKDASIVALALSPDGKTLAVSTGSVGRPNMEIDPRMEAMGPSLIQLWSIDQGKMERELKNEAGVAQALAFNPSGSMLAALQLDGAVHVWDLATGKERKTLGGMDGRVNVFAFAPDGQCIATAGEGTGIQLWEIATWKTRRQFVGHRGAIRSLAFTPDGGSLASGSADTSILIWDVTGLRTGLIEASELSAREREEFWSDLSSDDAARANQALWAMAADAKGTVPFLAKLLQPVAAIPKDQMTKLIADLDSPQFKTREQAAADLMKLGEQAEQALRDTLANKPTLELQRRIEPFLKKMEGPLTSPELLRTLRALEILEHIGNADAKKALEGLAGGAPAARVTRDAKAALERLRKRSG
jgi:WD40 repeat protein